MAKGGVGKEGAKGQTQHGPLGHGMGQVRVKTSPCVLASIYHIGHLASSVSSGLVDSGPSLDVVHRDFKESIAFYSSCFTSMGLSLLVWAIHSTSKAGLPLILSHTDGFGLASQESDRHFSTHVDFIRRLVTFNPDSYSPHFAGLLRSCIFLTTLF